MKSCCIAVIGHVDHGKTALVHALTGIETDRLPEEKTRGLSIATGFAHSTYPNGIIDFIDTPGHADFIQTMISGATGARSVLLVISAVEGLGAQTLEHLSIGELLGINSGVIAVTKSDMLAPPERAAQVAKIRQALSQTPFANAPLVACSARTGDGIDALHEALEVLLAQSAPLTAPLQSYLPIDRVFSLPGLGTIVTGTLLGQDLAVEDMIALQPGGQEVTLRGLQSRGSKRDRIHVGERMAANIRGIAVADISRGAVLSAGGTIAPSNCIDAHLELQPSAKQALKHMQDVRVLFGTSSEVAQIRLFGGGQIAPAQSGFAQLRFKKPVVGFAGQRAILRRLSPSETIGGAVFLDPLATQTKAGDKTRLQLLEALQLQGGCRIAKAVANGGVASLTEVARLSRMHPNATRLALGTAFLELDKDLICHKADFDARKADVLTTLAAFHKEFPLRTMAPRNAIIPETLSPSLLRHVEKTLAASGQIIIRDTRLALCRHDPVKLLSADQHRKLADVECAFQQAGLTPPTRKNLPQDDLGKDLIQLLIDTGRLVSLQNISLKQHLLFHSDALTAALGALHIGFPPPTSFTTGEARSVLATSRRIIVPLLEHFDTCGCTIRNGDMRQIVAVNDVSLRSPTC